MMDGVCQGSLCPVRPGDNGSDVRRDGCTCNGNSGALLREEDSDFRNQKHGVYCSNAPTTRINRPLRLLNVYISICILFCCVHLGAAVNNTTQDTNLTTIELTTIIYTTEVTTDFLTAGENTEDGSHTWVYGLIGAAVLIAVLIIIICIRKGCACRCKTPPSPVPKDHTPTEDFGQALDTDRRYHGRYPDDNQGNIGIPMEPVGQGTEDPIYQNTTIQPEPQDNAAFGHFQPVSLEDENFPDHPPPSPPRGATIIDVDTRKPLGMPFVPPGPTPTSPLDDFPDRPPPAVPFPRSVAVNAEINDKFNDFPLSSKPNKKKKEKKEKKKEKKNEDKQKAPQRQIDPDEQIRDDVPIKAPSHLDTSKLRPVMPVKFDFKRHSSEPEAEDDFGGNYEEMSPVNNSPVKGWSPRQPQEEDFGAEYEDVGDGGDDDDYDGEYEIMDPNAPQPRKPQVVKKALTPSKLTGQRSEPDINQRHMLLPPVTSGEDDYGGEYEEMCSNESPKRQVPGGNIDYRPQIPIPSEDEEQDHGGVYEEVVSPTISPKRKPPVAIPKTAKKPSKPPPADDFGQEYGNTGTSKAFPVSTTQRLPPSLPSSSTLPQTPKGLFKEDDDWLPPPPPEHEQHSIPSPDGLDYGDQYDDVAIKPPIKKKPPVSRPKVAKKPSNTGGSTTLPISPNQQLSPSDARSSATLPGSGGKELIEDDVYMNLPALKGNLSTHYHNLPAPEKTQEQISSSGYSFFSERPK